MKTAKLIIDGKEIEVQLTDEQVVELTASEKVTGFERAKVGERYELVTMFGDINFNYEKESGNDNAFYITANYYTDKKLAEWCTRSDTLTRQMRRWAAEHNPEPIDSYGTEPQWYLTWDIKTKTVEAYFNINSIDFGKAFFNTRELAEAAIEEFGSEIKWLIENRPKWF